MTTEYDMSASAVDVACSPVLDHSRQDYLEHAEQCAVVNNVPGNVVHNVLKCDLESEIGAVGGDEENICKVDTSLACMDKIDVKCNICEGSCNDNGNTWFRCTVCDD